MVGDGINDAPAPMQADVGIAFGSGADIAIESADVIILNQRLGAVLDAHAVSRHSYRKIVQNVLLAFVFNGIGIPAAATGLVYSIWGMVAMAVSVTTIFINSLWGRGAYFLRRDQGRWKHRKQASTRGRDTAYAHGRIARRSLRVATVVLEIVGNQRMHCEGCQERVETMLGELPGVRKVRATARKQRVEVLFDPTQVQQNAIEERMREAGYETTGATRSRIL